MPLNISNFVVRGSITHNDLLQFAQLFTGGITDQPVTFANSLTVGGFQGTGSVAFRTNGVIGQTANLIEARMLASDAQPVLSIDKLGYIHLGPGGGTAPDVAISRTGTNLLTLTGNLTVSGSFTIGGAFVITGGLTIPSGGITVTGTSTITGALSVSGAVSSASFSLSATVSQIVPGATSLSLRNNANSQDNLIITDAGNATLRGTLSILATTSTAQINVGAPGVLQFTVPNGRIISGATAFIFKDSTDAIVNVSIADATGNMIVRGMLTVGGGNPAGAGVFRLPNNQAIDWRNAGNSNDHSIFWNGSDQFVIQANLSTIAILVAGPALYMNDTSNAAAIGAIRFTNGQTIGWRNGANNGNDQIGFDGADRFSITGITAPTTATAGSGPTVPSNVQEFMPVLYNGNIRKIALYLN